MEWEYTLKEINFFGI